MTIASLLAMSVIAFAVSAFGAQPDEQKAARIVSVGPRGAVGPDEPLSESENKQFASRVTVEGHTAAAVQVACSRAVKEGTRVVFLPAGQYVFDTQVDVPGGLTWLGESANTLCQNEGRNTTNARSAKQRTF